MTTEAFTSGTIYTYSSSTWAYADVLTGADGNFYLAHRGDNNTVVIEKWDGAQWNQYTSFTAASVGAVNITGDLDLVIDAQGILHVAFQFEGSGTTNYNTERGIKYGTFNGSSWTFNTIDSASHPNGWISLNDPSLAIDAQGNAHVAYLYKDATNHESWIVYAQNTGGLWQSQDITYAPSGTNLTKPWLALTSDGRMQLAYQQESNFSDYYVGDLYFTEASLGGGFPPATKLIDAATDEINQPYQISVDEAGKLHISFTSEFYGPEEQGWPLLSSVVYDFTNESGSWSKNTVLSSTTDVFKPVVFQGANGVDYLLVQRVDPYNAYSPLDSRVFYHQPGGAWTEGTILNIAANSREITMAVDDNGQAMVITLDVGLRTIAYTTGEILPIASNTAPVILTSPLSLQATNEDTTSASFLVSELLSRAHASDADTSDILGIAVTGFSGNGTWEYSTDGTYWTSFGAVSASSSLLLGPNTQLRYIPDATHGEMPNLSFRAWDMTRGTASSFGTHSTADTTTNGGDSAFSTSVTTATLPVTEVNDVPVISLTPMSGFEDTDIALTGIDFSDRDGDQGWLTLDLITSEGTLSVRQDPGISVILATDNHLIIQGSMAALKALIATSGLTVRPAPDFHGTLNLTVNVRDNISIASMPTTVSVQAAAEAPSISPAVTVEDSLSTNGIVIAAAAEDGAAVTHFRIDWITDGWLFKNDGVTPIHNGDFITAAEASAGLKFLPDLEQNTPSGGSFSFQVRASLDASGTGMGPSVTHAITATEVNDAPVAADDVVSPILEDSGPYVLSAAQLLANDSAGPYNEQAQTLTITQVGNAIGGTVQLVNGNVVFTPASDHWGPASFTYTVEDNGTTNGSPDPRTSTATVRFDVTPTADTPVVFTTIALEDQVTPNAVIITPSPSDGLEVTHFKITGITGGTLYMNNGGTPAPVHDGMFISTAQGINGLTFVPNPDFHGNATFQVQASTNETDLGLGGTPAIGTIMVLPVNDTPDLTMPSAIAGQEDAPVPLTGVSIHDRDGNVPVQVILSVAAGTILVSEAGAVGVTLDPSGDLILSGSVSDINALFAGGKVTYTGPQNYSGTVGLHVIVNDGQPGGLTTGHTLINLAPTPDTATISFTQPLQAVEDVSSLLSGIVIDNPDGPAELLTVVLQVSSGRFEAVSQNGVTVTQVHPGEYVLSGTAAAIKDYMGSNALRFVTAQDATDDVTLTVTVANTTSTNTNSATISVSPVNDAPQATNGTISLLEDGSHTFSVSDFIFGDTADVPADALASVIITNLPFQGALIFNDQAVVAGQEIAAADLGKLVFTPAADGNGIYYSSIGFALRDTGGTPHGGQDVSNPAHIRIDVTPVNDAPQTADARITTGEDSVYTFSVADIPFTDTTDAVPLHSMSANNVTGAAFAPMPNPSHSLKALVITSLPTSGSLLFNGTAVSAGQVINAADIGNLTFAPSKDANGVGYASFKFRVQDDGGVDNGGVDLSAEHTMTIDVTPQNDAPVGTGIADQSAISGEPWSVSVKNSFVDIDGDTLAFSATLADGSALPAWMHIDTATGVVSGTPPFGWKGSVALSVKATDPSGASVTQQFNLGVDLPLVDGTPVDRTLVTNPDGSSTQTVVIPVIQPTRTDTVGNNGVADIPLVTVGGQNVLSVQVGLGTALTALGNADFNPVSTANRALIRQILMRTMDGSFDQSSLTAGGSSFLSDLDDEWLVTQTIILNQLGVGSPLVIQGQPTTPNRDGSTAIVLDTSQILGTPQIQIENIDFVAVVGAATLRGGSGRQVVHADGASQNIVLGADDDEIHGGAGDDYIGSEGGDDKLYGDQGNDTVSGGIGNDFLFGGNGVDQLFGGEGNDYLDGGAGHDVLAGGVGNDVHIVDDIHDVVVEAKGEGTDTVYASTNYALTGHVENLILTGDAILGYANSLNNVIRGNDQANKILARSGNDKVYGGAGNDRLEGESGNDRLYGETGNDVLVGGTGHDRMDGGTGNDRLHGGSGNDVLYGRDGNDWLHGSTGVDRMVGGKGADAFVFRSIHDSAPTTYGRDIIYDFSRKQKDKIDLKAIDANQLVKGNQAFTFTGEKSFFSFQAGELRYQKVKGGVEVYGDVNGDGRADLQIFLKNVSALHKSDFIL